MASIVILLFLATNVLLAVEHSFHVLDWLVLIKKTHHLNDGNHPPILLINQKQNVEIQGGKRFDFYIKN